MQHDNFPLHKCLITQKQINAVPQLQFPKLSNLSNIEVCSHEILRDGDKESHLLAIALQLVMSLLIHIPQYKRKKLSLNPVGCNFFWKKKSSSSQCQCLYPGNKQTRGRVLDIIT